MGRARLFVGVVFVVALCFGASCDRVFRGKTSQPNPLVHPNETLRISEPIVIITGDMELEVPRAPGVGSASLQHNERYHLRNKASFTVVSRDRLRFHVQLEHKWEEFADLHNWDASIIDSTGRRFEPEQVEQGKPEHVVFMWDYEVRSYQPDAFGDVGYVRNDGHRRRQPLGSLSLFRGRGDYVFYARDIFTPELEWISLVVERRGMAFVFTWKFTDLESGSAVAHATGSRRPAP